MHNKAFIFILSSLGLMTAVISSMIIYSVFLTGNNTEQTALYYLLAIG